MLDAIGDRALLFCGSKHTGTEVTALRYKPNQHFKQHHDGAFRRFSLVAYLNTLNANDGGTFARERNAQSNAHLGVVLCRRVQEKRTFHV